MKTKPMFQTYSISSKSSPLIPITVSPLHPLQNRAALTYDHDVILVLSSSMDGGLQRTVPIELRLRILHLSHYSQLAKHPVERCSYD